MTTTQTQHTDRAVVGFVYVLTPAHRRGERVQKRLVIHYVQSCSWADGGGVKNVRTTPDRAKAYEFLKPMAFAVARCYPNEALVTR